MRLSNPLACPLIIAVAALIFTSCNSAPAGNDNTVALTEKTPQHFPFAVREPEVYSCEAYLTAGESVRRWGITKNGDRMRYDHFDGDTPSVSEINADKRYIIDHRRRVYAEVTGGGLKDSSPAGPPPLFLMGAEYVKYRDAGMEGGFRKYVAESGGEQVVTYFDEEMRMIVRQEFFTAEDSEGSRRTAAIFELRNFRPDADESLFQLPAGYRSVPLANIDTRPKAAASK
jgi:hypothetical protein